ncbi:MAG: MCE family protein [Bacteroidales bacterium]|nr:MCE family protein [Bacteroidales bacterium]
MDTHTQNFKIRLGLFIAGGIALFVIAIFLIGKQQNLFNPVFELTTTFNNVSGLQVGNNIRLTGINVGTVDNIKILNDSTVKVDMLIRKNVQEFIKEDCIVAIGSEGLIGDRLINITRGSPNAPIVKPGQHLASTEPIETDAIMASLHGTAANAEIITAELVEIMFNINSGNGTLGRLINDASIAENFSQTMYNLKTSSKSLDENMEAAKNNFLLRGYFTKKEKAAMKLLEEEQKKSDKEKKADEKKEAADKKAADRQQRKDDKQLEKEQK